MNMSFTIFVYNLQTSKTILVAPWMDNNVYGKRNFRLLRDMRSKV